MQSTPKIISDFRKPEPVNDEAADHDGENVGKAVDRLEEADVLIRKAKLCFKTSARGLSASYA